MPGQGKCGGKPLDVGNLKVTVIRVEKETEPACVVDVVGEIREDAFLVGVVVIRDMVPVVFSMPSPLWL